MIERTSPQSREKTKDCDTPFEKGGRRAVSESGGFFQKFKSPAAYAFHASAAAPFFKGGDIHFLQLHRRLNKPRKQRMPIARRGSKFRMKLASNKPRVIFQFDHLHQPLLFRFTDNL